MGSFLSVTEARASLDLPRLEIRDSVAITVTINPGDGFTWKTSRRGESIGFGLSCIERTEAQVLAEVKRALEYAASDAALDTVVARRKLRADEAHAHAIAAAEALRPVTMTSDLCAGLRRASQLNE